MDLAYSYMKQRGEFGRQPLFCEYGPEMCDSILPNPAEFKNYILRNPVNQISQNTPSFSQREINTIRCSLLLSTSFDGMVLAWDFLRRQHMPVLTQQVCNEPLLQVKIQELGSLAAVGSSLGNIYMTELSPNLTQSDKNDKQLMNAVFERESKREKILEARLREIRLKQRQAEEGSPKHSVGEIDFSVGDRDLVEATQEFMALVRKELANM